MSLQKGKAYVKLTGQANRLTTFYHRRGSISFRVVDAMGNYIRTATYTNVSMAYSKTMAYKNSNGNIVVE